MQHGTSSRVPLSQIHSPSLLNLSPCSHRKSYLLSAAAPLLKPAQSSRWPEAQSPRSCLVLPLSSRAARGNMAHQITPHLVQTTAALQHPCLLPLEGPQGRFLRGSGHQPSPEGKGETLHLSLLRNLVWPRLLNLRHQWQNLATITLRAPYRVAVASAQVRRASKNWTWLSQQINTLFNPQ